MNYYVISNGDIPFRMMFDEVAAKAVAEETGNKYIDIFDSQGIHLKALIRETEYFSESGVYKDVWKDMR